MSRRVLTLLLVTALSACQPKIALMTEQQAQQMKQMTDSMVPRCVGRYLIDLPRDFVINPVARAVIEKVALEIEPMTESEFQRRFEVRRNHLERVMLPGDDKNRPHLRRVIALPDGSPGAVFDRSEEEVSSSRLGRSLELMAWKAGYFFTATIQATDTTFPEDQGDSVAKQLTTDIPEKLAHLLNLYGRTRGLADGEVPKEAGVCFRHGFVAGPATDQEWIDMNYHLASAEDVYFTFRFLSDIGPQGTTLPQRGAAIEAELADARGKTLRRGERRSNDLRFDEWLARRQSNADVTFYDFMLELNSKDGNAQKPLFIADMTSGLRHPHPQRSREESAVLSPISKATLGEAESVALWDAVTATLRIRPGAF